MLDANDARETTAPPTRVTPIAGGAERAADAGEAERLKAVAAAAVAKIDSTPGKRRAEARYGMPWFLFVGDAAESTALLGPLQRSPSGNGGAPAPLNWSWSLLPGLVGINLGDGLLCRREDDKDRWRILEAALEIMTGYRGKLPFDGIVAVVSVETLGDPARAATLAEHLRAVVNEAYRSIRSDFPVHLVISGIERLSGHDAFFAALPQRVAEQAIGHINDPPAPLATSPTSPGDIFQGLLGRLESVRLGVLADLRAEIDRFGVFQFVEEMTGLRAGLEAVERGLFGVDPWEHAVVWRSVFFTAPGAAKTGAHHARDLLERFLPRDAGLIPPK